MIAWRVLAEVRFFFAKRVYKTTLKLITAEKFTKEFFLLFLRTFGELKASIAFCR